MTPDQAKQTVEQTIVQPAADAAVDRRGHRQVIVLGVLTVLLIAGGVAMFLADRSQQVAQADELKKSVTALAQQVTQLGGTPVVQPPGVPGPTGPPGPAGRDGANGRDGRDGITPACVSEPPQCRGVDGDSGTAGQAGKDGQDGAPGKDGRDGVNGQPPASWTWVDGEGRTQSCARDTSSPDTEPKYTCTAPSSGPPGTTTTSPPPLLRR